jgi:transposase
MDNVALKKIKVSSIKKIKNKNMKNKVSSIKSITCTIRYYTHIYTTYKITLKKFDSSWCLIDLGLRWIYAGIIVCAF